MLATIQKSSGHELSIARFSVVAILVIATATSTTRTHQRHFLVAGFTPSIHSARFLTPKKHSISIVTSSNPLEDQQSWSRTVTANDPFLVKAHLSPTSAPSPHVSNKQPRNVRKERLHLVLKYLQALQSKRRWMKRRLVTCYMAMTIFLTTIFGAAGSATAAVGAGRMGGSFGPSSSSSRMTPSTSSYSRSYSQSGGKSHSYTRARPSAPSITVYSRPVLPFRRHHRPIYVSSDGPVATRFSTSDVLLLTGTGALIAYGFSNNFRNDRHNDGTRRHRQQPQSLLGPGSTVASITVNLNVPDRTNPNCILQKLRRLSQQADTSSRQGVQRMVSEVALELLRDERSIVSASTQSLHVGTTSQAEREFQRVSTLNRSKFDRESVNKFGNDNYSEKALSSTDDANTNKATNAIVSMALAIEGDSTMLPGIRFRSDLLASLTRIASDAQVGDCLLSAEVLWAPENDNEILSKEDIDADYPNLIPL